MTSRLFHSWVMFLFSTALNYTLQLYSGLKLKASFGYNPEIRSSECWLSCADRSFIKFDMGECFKQTKNTHTQKMWHVTCDMWLVTCERWHMTHDRSHMTCDLWQGEGGEHSLKNFSSLTLVACKEGLLNIWRKRLTHLIN